MKISMTNPRLLFLKTKTSNKIKIFGIAFRITSMNMMIVLLI